MRVLRDTPGRTLGDTARAPYHETLWLYGHLVAQDRRARLVRQGERLGDATHQAIAFHDPKRLQSLGRDYEKAIGLEGAAVTSDPTFLEKARAFLLNGEQVIGDSPEPQPGGID